MSNIDRRLVSNMAIATAALSLMWSIPYGLGVSIPSLRTDLETSDGAVAGLFSVASSIYFGFGWLSGLVADRVGSRVVMRAGSMFFFAGLCAFSFGTDLMWCTITYAVGCGFGLATVYTPLLDALSRLRTTPPASRLAIATAGVGLGSVFGPVLVGLLLAFGWRWAYRIMALLACLGSLACAELGTRAPRVSGIAQKARPVSWGDRRLWYLYLSSCMASAIVYLPIIYFPSLAASYGGSTIVQSVIVSILGVVSVICRPLFGVFGRGRAALGNAYASAFICLIVATELWAISSNVLILSLSAVVFGIGYGGFVGLSPSLAILTDVGGSAAFRIGFFMSSSGVGSAIGVPSFAILRENVGEYGAVEAVAMLAVVGLIFAAFLKRELSLRNRLAH